MLVISPAPAEVIFETTSPYHNIRVLDEQGIRTLSFDGSMETRMMLRQPLAGHFEYTEYFHMPWLWNRSVTNVLMMGLGGASIQRSYQHYYPKVKIETVEIDPTVVDIAKKYFLFKETTNCTVHSSDGRVFLRRTKNKYDVILMDAYSGTRYGSFIPYHLATKEFFTSAADHLTEDGVLAYNVIGTFQGMRADIVGSMYRTLRTVFPQVYMFPARDSLNIVMIATKSTERMTPALMYQRANDLGRERVVTLPTFRTRASTIIYTAPANAANSPLLTDDFAPVDGLLKAVQR